MQEIGIIEEIASGHEKDIELIGFTIIPKTDGWLGIRKLYNDSSFWNRFKYKQVGTYYTSHYRDYKIGDKVKVEIENKKIINIEKTGHLNKFEQILHDPMYIIMIIAFIVVLIYSFNVYL